MADIAAGNARVGLTLEVEKLRTIKKYFLHNCFDTRATTQ